MFNHEISFGLIFGGVTGVIAGIIIVVLVTAMITIWKEEEKKKKHNYIIHFVAVNLKTQQRLEDTATVIGATSEYEALQMLKDYINNASKNPTIEQVEWAIEDNPQYVDWKNQTVFSYRYYG